MSTFNIGDKVRVLADPVTVDGYPVYWSEGDEGIVERLCEDGDIKVRNHEHTSRTIQYISPEFLELVPEEFEPVTYYLQNPHQSYVFFKAVTHEDGSAEVIAIGVSEGVSAPYTWVDGAPGICPEVPERAVWIEACIKANKVLPHISEFTVGSLWYNTENEMYYEVTDVTKHNVSFKANKLDSPGYSEISTERTANDLKNFEPADSEAQVLWFGEEEPQELEVGQIRLRSCGRVEAKIISIEDGNVYYVLRMHDEPSDRFNTAPHHVSEDTFREIYATHLENALEDWELDLLQGKDAEPLEGETESPVIISEVALREAFTYLGSAFTLNIDKLIGLAKRLS